MSKPSPALGRLAAVVLCLSPLLAGATAPVAATTSASPPVAVDTATQALHDAVSAVVVVALTEQFNGKDVAVDIDDYAVQIASARQRAVTGHGTAHVNGAAGKRDVVGFRYRTLYDVVDGQAGYPTISITGVGGGSERMVPNDSGLVDELDARVSSAISHDLGGRQVWLQLDDIRSYQGGDGYVRIDAGGLADFGADGRSPTRIEALYDTARANWLRVNYTLGDGAPGSADFDDDGPGREAAGDTAPPVVSSGTLAAGRR